MQIGTISKNSLMRLVKDEHTCLTPLRINNYFKGPLTGYALSFFAEQIINKYRVFRDYDFESVALVFLQNMLAEAEQRKDLDTRVEQTLRLLVLWNQKDKVYNQLICPPNVYLTNLRNEIELNLSHIKKFNLSKYQELYQLYNSDKTEQNLFVLQQQIAEQRVPTRISTDTTTSLNQIIKNAKTILETPTIKPQSTSKPFRTILGNVINISHTPSNQELFYSSVKKQIIHRLIEDRVVDIRSLENAQLDTIEEIITLYQSLWASRISASNLLNRTRLLEHFLNTHQQELSVIHPNLRKLITVDKVSAEQRSTMGQFLPERRQTIPNFDREGDSAQGELLIILPRIIELISSRSTVGQIIPEHANFVMDGDETPRELAVAYPKITELMDISQYSTLQRLNRLLFSPEHKWTIFNFTKDANGDQEEVTALSSQVFELMNAAKKSVFPRLNTQLFSREHSRTISHLIKDRGRLSPQVLSFLSQQRFTKNELFRIIEQGSMDEKVLLSEALNFAIDRITMTQENNINSMSTWKNLLTNAESNDYDFSKHYELDGSSLTFIEHVNRQEALVWNEIEKQVNQYRTTVSRQINNIGVLYSLLEPALKNDQVITLLGETQNVEQINQNLKVSLLRSIKENYWQKSKQDLQYLRPQASSSVIDGKVSAGVKDQQSPMVINPLSRLKSLDIRTRKYKTLTTGGEKSVLIQEESTLLPSSPFSSSLITGPQPSQQTAVVEVANREEPSAVFLQETLPTRLEKTLDIIRNPIINILKRVNISAINSNFIAEKLKNIMISPLKAQLLDKHFGSILNTEINNVSSYLINQGTNHEMIQLSNSFSSNDRVDYHKSTFTVGTDIENNAVMIMHTADQLPSQKRQNEDLVMPTQNELINRFGNLISNPNLPAAELIDRQTGSLSANYSPSVVTKDVGIPELIKKVSFGEHLIREEQIKVTEIHEKIKEQEEVINQMNQAYDQLREELASRINERKIVSMIMKELKDKLSLDKLRYGLQ